MEVKGELLRSSDASKRHLIHASLLYAAVLPFDFLPFMAGRSATFFASTILLVAFVQYIATARRSKGVRSSFSWPALMLAAWSCATLLWSVDFRGSLTAWLSLVLQLATVAALATALPHCWRRFLVWYLRAMTLLAAALLTQSADIDRSGRATLAGADENTIAMVVCMGFAVALCRLVLDTEKSRRVFVVLQLCVIVPAIVHIGSRTGVGAMVVTALFAALVVVLIDSQNKIRSLVLSIVAVIGGYYAFQYAMEVGWIPARVVAFVHAPEVTDSIRQNIILSYQATMDNWELFGIGYGADAAYLASTGRGFQHAHSLFWRTWIEMGYVGLILLGAVMWGALRGSWSAPWRTFSLVLWVPIATFAITLGGDRTSQFWLVIALGAASFSPSFEEKPGRDLDRLRSGG